MVKIKINPERFFETKIHTLSPFSFIVSILLCITQINAYVMKEKSEEYIAEYTKGIVIVSLEKN